MFEIHDTVEGALMKGLIDIKQSSNRMNIRLIQINLTIK
jgi:hypothetical protein